MIFFHLSYIRFFLTKAQNKIKSATKDLCGIKQEPYTIELSLLDVGARVFN
jgi:hypothetical protein